MAYSKAILLLGLLVLVMFFSEVFSRELAEEGMQTANVKKDGYEVQGGGGVGGNGLGGIGGKRPPATRQGSASESTEAADGN